MSDKTVEERLEKLEQSAHYHKIVERVDCNPEKATIIKTKLEEADKDKAKKKGGIFGDPVVVIE